MTLKSIPFDDNLLAQEHREQQALLEQLSLQHGDLRRQDVLAAMSDILTDEQRTISTYQQQRDAAAQQLLQQEATTNEQLNAAFANNERDRSGVTAKIVQNEELQKEALCSLIARNDSRAWGLCEQVRIVEYQLAKMTHLEIERRKLSGDERLVRKPNHFKIYFFL